MEIEKEREKRKFLVQNMTRLSNELDLLIKNNIKTLESVVNYSIKRKIEDWPKKVILFRACEWINQVRVQIDELITTRLLLPQKDELKLSTQNGGLRLLNELKINYSLKPVDNWPPWSLNHRKYFNIKPVSDCLHDKISRLNLEFMNSDLLVNLLKTEFIYIKLIEKVIENNQLYFNIDNQVYFKIDKQIEKDEDKMLNLPYSSDDYFLNISVDLKTGTIEFYGKEDKMQTIEPNLILDSHETINSKFQEPLVLEVGITPLRLFLFQARIKIGISFLLKLTEIPLKELETFAFSSNIENKLMKFIVEDDILNEEFRNILYKEIEDFLNFLLDLNISEYSRFLIIDFLLISFPVCLCFLDLTVFRNSKYFYLIKWAVPKL